jgi:ubiquitin carboxyl-terminal hydrolase 35/38
LIYLNFICAKLIKRKAIKPNNFVKFCTPSWFRLGQQQDSSEFLIFLLDNLQEQIKSFCQENPKMITYSNLITKLFGIQLTTEIICKKCSTKTNRSDVSFYLPLSFQDSSHITTSNNDEIKSLQTLIDNFFHTELLSSETDNSYQCSKCESLQSATKQILFTRDDSKNIQPPEYLILTLNRFIYNHSNKEPDASPTNKKIMDKLDYPSRLTIKTISNEKIINETYELNSIVIHSGSSLHYGHYYSYTTNKFFINEIDTTTEKMETDQQENKKNDYTTEWLLANDSQINTSTYDSLISNLNLFKDDTPYVLFYRRILDTESDESTVIDNENIKNKNLINFIEQDNKIYVVEEKNRIMNMIKMKKQAKNSTNSSLHNKNSSSSREDDDDVGGGSSSGQSDNYCSSDSQRDSGPRIIF